MSVRWTVGEAEMKRVRQPKRAMAPLQGASAKIENAESEGNDSPVGKSPEAIATRVC